MKRENKFLSYIKNKQRVVIAWCAIFLFFFLTFWSGWLISFVHSLILTLCMMVVSDIESRYFIKLLQDKRVFLFYIVNFFFVIIISAATIYLESIMLKFPQPTNVGILFVPFLIRLVLYIATIAITVISKLQQKENENQRVKNELESEKLNMELRFLKTQMAPHFLFNALNNIYSLVYTKDEKAPQSVLKLSDMMRYVMVDCQVDEISLEKEVKYIDAYIEFQQMSMENKSNVVFEKDIKNMDYKIPPMILQPLVENSFKHSRVVNDPNGYVHFYLLQEDNSLIFIARNSIKGMSVAIADANKKPQSGIGLENVRKRLELYYGDDFYFNAKFEDNYYSATIKIGVKS